MTVSDWIAGIISRWRLAVAVAAFVSGVAGLAVFLLPPVYQAHASFIPPEGAGILARPGGRTSTGSSSAQSGLASVDASLQGPRYYLKLLESETLRRRLLNSAFNDPREPAARNSVPLVEIMRPRSDDPSRRMEIASRLLSKAMSAEVEPRTNIISIDLRMRSPELAADVANRAIALVDELAQEQRSARARSRRVFIAARLDEARSELAVAEGELQSFEIQNRTWRQSPDLVLVASRLGRDTELASGRYVERQRQLELARLDEQNARTRLTVVDRAVVPVKAKWPRYGLLLLSGACASALLGFIAAALAAFIAGQRHRVLRPAPIPSDLPRSFLSRVGFPIFAWGLVFHSLAITILFGRFGISVEAVRTIAAWKEIAVVVFLVLVMIRAATGRGPGTTLAWPDFWIGGLLATAILFLLTENLWLRLNLPRQAELLGFRDSVYFMLLYFVGRSMPELASNDKAMRNLFILVVVTSVIGVVERIIVSPDMLVALGVAAYFQDFLGVSAFTVGNAYGLPLNYWTMIGGQLFRRAGSVYLSGQGFAVPFLLLFPLATAWVFLRPSRTRLQTISYLTVSAALILTLTRMTILIAVIQLILFVSLQRRPEWTVGVVAVCSVVFIAAFGLIPGFPTFVWHTLSWQEGSSVSHLNDWTNGLAVFFQNPLGSGLGTADQTAVRSGLKHLTGDNLYLKYGVEMGALGLGLLVLTLGALGRSAMQLYRRGVTRAQQRIGITLWLATVGIAINGITAVVFSSITLGWLFFWLAGAAVTVAQTLPDSSAPSQPAV